MAHVSVGARAGRSAPAVAPVLPAEERKVIIASSAGTVFEWYDFYLYGSLAVIIGKQFFSGLNPAAQYIFACWPSPPALRAAVGAIVFGRLGDLVGRKYTFLVTILIMGFSTFLVGLLPGYEDRRGRADHPDRAATAAGPGAGRRVRRCGHLCGGARAAWPRGLYTSFIQITATFGLFLSLLVILGCQTSGAFAVWGLAHSVPAFVVLLAVSV